MSPPDFPEGIDYDRWTHVVRPSPREAFADPLDLADLCDVRHDDTACEDS